MHIKIFGFGPIQTILNSRGSQDILVDDIPTVMELRKYLSEKYPKLNKMSFLISVNHVVATNSTPISEGDNIGLLPPFSGG